MSLFEARDEYRRGRLEKQEYIDRMQEYHALLLEYASFIEDCDIRSIEIADGCLIITSRTAGIDMICPLIDRRAAPFEILNFGSYERPEMEMALRLIDPGSTVADVGANIGWFSLNVAKQNPTARILAFEPVPPTFEWLRRNIERNEIENVKAFAIALSNGDGKAILYMRAGDSANASAANLNAGEGVMETACITRKLDDILGEAPLDFIKCDVEGGELFVIQGAQKAIERSRPVIWAEMLRKWSAHFGYHPNRIIELLEGLGYRCFTVQRDRLKEFCCMDEDTTETNFFFLHREAHAAKIEMLEGR